MFSDFELHVLGAAEHGVRDEPDSGDGNFAFRTPTLRQLDFTVPFFHNGSSQRLPLQLTFTMSDAVHPTPMSPVQRSIPSCWMCLKWMTAAARSYKSFSTP